MTNQQLWYRISGPDPSFLTWYDLRSMERLARIHRINRRLRRLGMHPRTPGTNEAIDTTKLVDYRAYAAGSRLVKPVHVHPDAFGWTPPS